MSVRTRLAVLALSLFAAACGDDTSANSNPAGTTPADPTAFIAHQVELIKAGNVAALKATMTERQRDKITEDMVAKGKSTIGNASIDELVGKTEESIVDGKKTVKIGMKNGRSLTTLIQVDGKWLADTIWFK